MNTHWHWHPNLAHGARMRRHLHDHRPPAWVREWMGMRLRPERGEVRFLVLDALAEGPSHGYEIIQTIEKKTEGVYKPSPGTIYPLLQMLEDLEHVDVEVEGKRKRYELTDAGRAELASHRDEVDEAYDRLGGSVGSVEGLDFGGWRRRVKKVMRSVGREARRGRIDPARRKQIKKVIDDALASIEDLLQAE